MPGICLTSLAVLSSVNHAPPPPSPDDLPDEEAELDDVSSSSGESEPAEEPPLTETPRKRCPLVDDEAEQEEEDDGDGEAEDGERDGVEGELKLVLEDDGEDGDCLVLAFEARLVLMTVLCFT